MNPEGILSETATATIADRNTSPVCILICVHLYLFQ